MKLLFLCTHNRCRSILAEAIARQVCGNLIEVRSAGSEPARKVHPLTLEQLALHDIPLRGLRSKAWSQLDYQPDFIITLCDSAAGESCPLGGPTVVRVHWPLADPTRLQDDYDACWQCFDEVIATLTTRMKRLRELFQRQAPLIEVREALQDEASRYAVPAVKTPKRQPLAIPPQWGGVSAGTG